MVIACLLVQQVEVLYQHMNMEMRAVSLHVPTVLLAISVTNTLSFSTLHLITKVIGTKPYTYTVLCNIKMTVGIFARYPDGFPTATNDKVSLSKILNL